MVAPAALWYLWAVNVLEQVLARAAADPGVLGVILTLVTATYWKAGEATSSLSMPSPMPSRPTAPDHSFGQRGRTDLPPTARGGRRGVVTSSDAWPG